MPSAVTPANHQQMLGISKSLYSSYIFSASSSRPQSDITSQWPDVRNRGDIGVVKGCREREIELERERETSQGHGDRDCVRGRE